jgi:hypothetical protein
MKNIILAILVLCTTITSCKKMDVDEPTLNVTTVNLSIKAGDTATFAFSGYADYINYYSGEPGSVFGRIDSFSRNDGSPEFQFSSAVSSAGTGITTGNNLSVLISTNFNGIYDNANVSKATWTDITKRVTLATTTTVVNSPIVNVNDLKAGSGPMYLAFRYQTSNPTLRQRQWTISNFAFRTKFPDGKQYNHATSLTDAAFTPFNLAGDSATWSSGTTLVHVGLLPNLPVDDDWVISKPFDLKKYTSIDPTRGSSDALGVVNIKNLALTGTVPANFKWRYATPGVYNAVFVSRNANSRNSKETIKSFTITVNP